MKKTQNLAAYLFIALVFFTVHTRGQQPTGYRIEGTITGVNSGLVRMLSDKDGRVLDSAVVAGGKFFLQGTIASPARLPFTITPGNWSFQAFVDNAALVFSIDTTGAQYYGEGSNRSALIWDIEEAGSELSDVYTRYKKETHLKYYLSLLNLLRAKSKAAHEHEEAAARVKQEWDSVVCEAFARQKAWIGEYISQFPSSIAGVYLFYEYYQSSPDRTVSYLDSVLNRFSGAAASSAYYQELAQMAARLKNRQPGSSLPAYILPASDGSSFSLSSTRGSYTLIDFWASWCVPCRKAIPAWKEVYARYRDQSFTIVSLSTDRNRDDWLEAVQKEQMPWVQVLDGVREKQVAEWFGIESIPFYVLLDKEGKVVMATSEEEAVRKKIEQLFR